ncbi:pyridoxal-phosphate-dependent aminotransferase family protein [Clostridium sp. WILCCON 0269]|uniref:Pyridoxal-phosphate-dependent aminotransferase family protein n=1 Tax=Candidatus Clostridium eludens TaxID=3381663 RepID=A0ABW8SVC0_9CLOT
MKVPYIMTPGPTEVRENVRFARSVRCTNPDLDIEFYDFYRDTCKNIGKFLKTKNQVRILGGEGMLGLEAACASLTEEEDRVLVIDNGIFGEGFSDLVKLYGGKVVFFKGNRRREIDVTELEEFLNKDSNFKYATIVHCDTPSGVLNNVSKICPLLKEKGILTLVDSVSAMGGEKLEVDNWKIDIVIGGSQKCISAPPGLTLVSMSEEALSAMKNRKEPIKSFYCNLLVWEKYYENKWFPYTPPISDIIGLKVAIDNILEEEDILERHSRIGKAIRKTIQKAGLNLYGENGYSNTVTVIEIPKSIDENQLRKYMLDNFNVLIAGSFGYLEGKVIRIGHMGENAKEDIISYTLYALEKALKYFGFECKCNMSDVFLKSLYT